MRKIVFSVLFVTTVSLGTLGAILLGPTSLAAQSVPETWYVMTRNHFGAPVLCWQTTERPLWWVGGNVTLRWQGQDVSVPAALTFASTAPQAIGVEAVRCQGGAYK